MMLNKIIMKLNKIHISNKMDNSIISNQSFISNDSNDSNNFTNSTISNSSVYNSTISDNSTKTMKDIEECCICFHELISEVAYLECNHKYHFECLSKWQQKKQTQNILCPICRQNSVILSVSDTKDLKDITHLLDEIKESKQIKNKILRRRTYYDLNDDINSTLICCTIL
jgi:hypothetical protein